jgi:transcriptional regulator with XRE-family HTH domain
MPYILKVSVTYAASSSYNYHMDRNKLIGQRIREARARMGFSQQRLAIKMDLSYQQIQKYERGQSNFKIPRLEQLADVLGMTIEELAAPEATKAPADVAEKELVSLYRKIKSSPLKRKALKLLSDLSGVLKKL